MTRKEYLESLKEGDKVTRLLGGTVPMLLIVKEVRGAIIILTTPPEDDLEGAMMIGKILSGRDQSGMKAPTWDFSRTTGAEIDIDLGWDGYSTGSYIKQPENGKEETGGSSKT